MTLPSSSTARFDISIIPNGVNAEMFDSENRDWMPARLLSVGRLVHQKGFDLAMRALAELKDMQWQWKIVGDGPLMRTLRSLADELGILDRVTFTRIPEQDGTQVLKFQDTIGDESNLRGFIKP